MKLDTKKLGAKISEYAVFIALVLLVAAMVIFADGFATSSNLLNLLRQASFNGLIAFGMTLVILSDGIDLSVGSVFALSAIICAELLMSGMNAVLAVLIALVAGTALGATRAISTARTAGMPNTSSSAQIIALSANTEPTDRSMPSDRMTRVIPKAIRPLKDA